MKQRLAEIYTSHFGGSPAVVARGPGRVNLIGDHTDYNQGFVMPMAIEQCVRIAFSPRADQMVRVWSADFGELAEFDLNQLTKGGPSWAEYIKGVAWAIAGAGMELRGWDGVVTGNVPAGAGLSSSAALELAACQAFLHLSQQPLSPREQALLCQRAENHWVGVNCGIMDQLISAAGVAGRALLIDCRTLETTAAPLPAGMSVVVLDTGTRRQLENSNYNNRRGECEDAALRLGVQFLRDVSAARFAALESTLPEPQRRRARHVVTENDRVMAAAAAMGAGDSARLGRLMNESHESLRQDFEVSSPALDLMVGIAREQPGCLGARMTGAGFGGCAVAIVESSAEAHFARTVATVYKRQSGHEPAVYICHAAAGAGIEHL